MTLKRWHCYCLIVLAVITAYYPALHAGYNSVDDMNMVSWMENTNGLIMWDLLFPKGELYYYRPLTIISFFFDHHAWGMIASFMHLENILLHLGCSLLVFNLTVLITVQIPQFDQLQVRKVGLFSALIFALHPLATESVCWISGRTDLLACFFLLIAVCLLVLSLKKNCIFLLCVSAFSLFLACLAKEVAVFILPGLLWAVIFYPGQSKSIFQRIKTRTCALAFPIAAVTCYFIMRHFAVSRDNGIKTAIEGISGNSFDLFDKMRIALKIYGFYFKKIFFPWPLNYGITEVHWIYAIIGIFLIVIVVWILLRADFLCSFGLISFLVLSPALLIPFGKMAWTPVAERYLYISLSFLMPMLSVLLYKSFQFFQCKEAYNIFMQCVIVVVLFSSTCHRSWVWQDNERLYNDTVKKNPNFVPAKTELASALMAKGRVKEAEEVLSSVNTPKWTEDYIVDDLNLAQIIAENGNPDRAREMLVRHLDKNHKQYHELLQGLLRINDLRLGVEDVGVKLDILLESLQWLKEQQRVRPSSFTNYRIAKVYLAIGEKEKALDVFRQVLSDAPKDVFYREPTEKFIETLQSP